MRRNAPYSISAEGASSRDTDSALIPASGLLTAHLWFINWSFLSCQKFSDFGCAAVRHSITALPPISTWEIGCSWKPCLKDNVLITLTTSSMTDPNQLVSDPEGGGEVHVETNPLAHRRGDVVFTWRVVSDMKVECDRPIQR